MMDGSTENSFIAQGFVVKFPEGRKPFAAQKAVISKVLEAIKGKKNALLESPTGTGKVFSQLLRYIKNYLTSYLSIRR
jgi:Rad3-related DNA helicase